MGKRVLRTRKKKKIEASFARVTSSTFKSDGFLENELNFTLEENKHLDSFDKLIEKERGIWIAEEKLKKEVCATYNRDSSVEGSFDDSHFAHDDSNSGYSSRIMTRSMLKSNNQMSNSDRSLSPLTNENSVQIGPATAITIDDSRELSLNNFNISTKNRTQSIDQHAIIDLNNESEVAKNAGARSVGNTSRLCSPMPSARNNTNSKNSNDKSQTSVSNVQTRSMSKNSDVEGSKNHSNTSEYQAQPDSSMPNTQNNKNSAETIDKSQTAVCHVPIRSRSKNSNGNAVHCGWNMDSSRGKSKGLSASITDCDTNKTDNIVPGQQMEEVMDSIIHDSVGLILAESNCNSTMGSSKSIISASSTNSTIPSFYIKSSSIRGETKGTIIKLDDENAPTFTSQMRKNAEESIFSETNNNSNICKKSNISLECSKFIQSVLLQDSTNFEQSSTSISVEENNRIPLNTDGDSKALPTNDAPESIHKYAINSHIHEMSDLCNTIENIPPNHNSTASSVIHNPMRNVAVRRRGFKLTKNRSNLQLSAQKLRSIVAQSPFVRRLRNRNIPLVPSITIKRNQRLPKQAVASTPLTKSQNVAAADISMPSVILSDDMSIDEYYDRTESVKNKPKAGRSLAPCFNGSTHCDTMAMDDSISILPIDEEEGDANVEHEYLLDINQLSISCIDSMHKSGHSIDGAANEVEYSEASKHPSPTATGNSDHSELITQSVSKHTDSTKMEEYSSSLDGETSEADSSESPEHTTDIQKQSSDPPHSSNELVADHSSLLGNSNRTDDQHSDNGMLSYSIDSHTNGEGRDVTEVSQLSRQSNTEVTASGIVEVSDHSTVSYIAHTDDIENVANMIGDDQTEHEAAMADASPKSRKNIGFNDCLSIHEVSRGEVSNVNPAPRFSIAAGKWRRSVFQLRNILIAGRVSKEKDEPVTVTQRRKSVYWGDSEARKSLRKSRAVEGVIVLEESDVESTCSSDYSSNQNSFDVLSSSRTFSLRRSVQRPGLRRQTSYFDQSSHLSNADSFHEADNLQNTALNLDFNQIDLKVQLLKRCGQTEPLLFDEIYSERTLPKCRKIGEGVYGEVFLNEGAKSAFVLKIIPIEGDREVNGSQQKRFDEILQEVIISQELSALRNDSENRSAGFVEVLSTRCVEGRYPAHLCALWNEYRDNRGTENDDPEEVFGDDQLYVVFELAHCGLDLEAFQFKNAEQSFSVFKQVAHSLAVAEQKFQFEHRDLHWGNVLILPTAEKFITFIVGGKSINIATHGVRATIIDYTLSRIVYKSTCLYQDLAADPMLFEADGDYQFQIYRLMQKETKNCWERYEPFTNVLWLHYLIDKMINGVRYTSRKASKHRNVIDELMKLRDQMLELRSAYEYTETY